MTLDAWQWLLVALGALILGFSKTGIGGLTLLAVALFAQIFPSTKQVSGLILPLLIVGDLVATGAYRRHVQWKFLWKLFPWTALGVLLGWLAMSRIDDREARLLIGAIIVGMVLMQLHRRSGSFSFRFRQRPPPPTVAPPPAAVSTIPAPDHGIWFAPTMGVLAGFTTLVANAAGPLMALYLLSMRLPKMEFMGTGAVFFMILNWFKVPFMVNLDLITLDTLKFDLLLAPAVVIGAFAGRALLPHVNQRLFENLALALSAAAGLRMLLP